MASRAPELDVSLDTGINLRGIIQRYYFFRKSPKAAYWKIKQVSQRLKRFGKTSDLSNH
jgi:hypothetical protein